MPARTGVVGIADAVLVEGGPSTSTPSIEPVGTPGVPSGPPPVVAVSLAGALDAGTDSTVRGIVFGAVTTCGTGTRCACGFCGWACVGRGLASGVPRAGGGAGTTGIVHWFGARSGSLTDVRPAATTPAM